MALVPWKPQGEWGNPFRELEEMQQEMNRLFHLYRFRSAQKRGDVFGGTWGPAVDIHDEKNRIRVKADIPGLDRKDIDVSLHGNTLVIKGEKKQESEIKKKGCVSSERFYGCFNRAVPLPGNVDARNVHATYKHGVLELLLPKKSGAQHKLIKISVK